MHLRGASDRTRTEFEALLEGQLDTLYASAMRLTRNARDAEDLVQDSVLRAFRFFDKFERGTNFRAWLFKILTNTFINRYRRTTKERSIVEGRSARRCSNRCSPATPPTRPQTRSARCSTGSSPTTSSGPSTHCRWTSAWR
jgi:RNA polymerase sigma factor (sigma-70 family)